MFNFTALEEKIYNETLLGQDVKSSHWKHYTKDFIYKKNNNSVEGISGFGNNSPRSLARKLYHKVFQWFYFRHLGKYWTFEAFQAAQRCTNEQDRAIDVDVLRHVFTFNLLKTKPSLSQLNNSCCVIGDGQSNFCSLALQLNLFGKIVSINLPEVLLSDLQLIKKLKNVAAEDVRFASTQAELDTFLNDETTNLILISASNCEIIRDKGIELFINIASMQEMTPSLVEQYFDLIKSNKATFYCCNREKKILPAGEELIFENYPWGDGEILLDELCPWHQYFYEFDKKFKFKTLYDGPIRHRFVKFL